jgi:hypothetical protein
MSVTRNARTETAAVVVDATNSESLVYRVTVEGGTTGTFTLVDARSQQLLMSSKDTPISTESEFVYEREWPKPADNVSATTSHAIGFHFLGVTRYQYQLLHKRRDGSVVPLMDVEYLPSSDTDSFFENLFVATF